MRAKLTMAFLYLSVVWGSTYLLIKLGLDYWPPFLLAAARGGLACLVLLAVRALRSDDGDGPVEWSRPIIFGVVNGIALGLLFWGEQYIPTGQASVLIGAVPLFTMLLSRWWYREPVTLSRGLGAGVGLMGVLLAMLQRQGAGFAGDEGLRLLGQLAVLGTAVGYAASYAISKYFKGDLLTNTAIHQGTAGIVLVILSALLDPRPTGAELSLPALGILLYLALVGSAIAHWCKAFLLRHLPPVQATYTALINPVVAVLLGVSFQGEHFGALDAAGIALVLLGAWLVSRPASPVPATERPAGPAMATCPCARPQRSAQ